MLTKYTLCISGICKTHHTYPNVYPVHIMHTKSLDMFSVFPVPLGITPLHLVAVDHHRIRLNTAYDSSASKVHALDDPLSWSLLLMHSSTLKRRN